MFRASTLKESSCFQNKSRAQTGYVCGGHRHLLEDPSLRPRDSLQQTNCLRPSPIMTSVLGLHQPFHRRPPSLGLSSASSAQFSRSVVSDSATPWTAACQASLSFTITWSLLKLMSIESVMPSNHLILCHPLLLLPSILPSIRVFSSESVLCIRWPKY